MASGGNEAAGHDDIENHLHHHRGKPGAGPLLNSGGIGGPTQDQGLLRSNGPIGTQGFSEKYGPSERQGGVCKATRLQGLEVCPHLGAGCTWRGTSSELSRHLATEVAAHLALVTQECRRQAEEIDRLRGKLEEASVGREVLIIIIIVIIIVVITIFIIIIINSSFIFTKSPSQHAIIDVIMISFPPP